MLALNHKIMAKRQIATEKKNQTRFFSFVKGSYKKKHPVVAEFGLMESRRRSNSSHIV